ncbi:hypothetical protein E2C01_041563 [Portunus trituberculatus]|uniref:Uncharacterized protein n=1 Tax=Portunus trituberculatus TaxID=210409 RepID=A0A5B7FQQ1_PORTR|nr:hypothetical protein [Portunus trituberculatus]
MNQGSRCTLHSRLVLKNRAKINTIQISEGEEEEREEDLDEEAEEEVVVLVVGGGSEARWEGPPAREYRQCALYHPSSYVNAALPATSATVVIGHGEKDSAPGPALSWPALAALAISTYGRPMSGASVVRGGDSYDPTHAVS